MGAGCSAPASSCERSRSCANRPFERLDGSANARHEGPHVGVPRLGGECRCEESHGVQRLAQVVARRREEPALRATRRLGGRARSERCLGLCLELGDQVEVVVAHGERLRQHIVHLAPERDDEAENDDEHERREEMRSIAFERDANDQRHEHSEDEAVERRPVHGGEAQSAEDHAELADDEECLIRSGRREHRDRGGAPQCAGDSRADRPIRAPAPRIGDFGPRSPVGPCEDPAPYLVGEDRGEPYGHRPAALLLP